MQWKQIVNVSKSPLSSPDDIYYQEVLKDLDENEDYRFGIAAGNEITSTGIRWATSIVDETKQ